MNGTKHIARLGRSYDMGTYNLGADLDVAGCTARLKVGRRQTSTSPGVGRLEILSSPAPGLGVFVFDPTARTVAIDLHQNQLATIGLGEWCFEIDLLRATGEVLEGPSGTFEVRGQVPSPPA